MGIAGNVDIMYPFEGVVFDYFVGSGKHAGSWVKWEDAVPQYVPSLAGASFASVVVPTVDGTRLDYVASLCLEAHRPVLLIGAAATGKSTLLSGFLRSHEERTGAHSLTARLNYFSDSQSLQRELEAPLERRGGRVFGPAGGHSELVYFVDDLNMPKVLKYGTQTAVELLRQWADYKGWYDREDLTTKKSIVGCSLVAAMSHKAGSFFVAARLMRHFAALGCQQPSDTDLELIFGSILGSHFAPFNASIQATGPPLVTATLALYRDACTRFLPSTQKFHYLFTLRDLASVFEGLCLSKPNLYRSSLGVCRLWYHECVRVFSDRLVTPQEGLRLKSVLKDVAKRFLSEHAAPQDALFTEPCIFTHFATPVVDDMKGGGGGGSGKGAGATNNSNGGGGNDNFVGSYLAVANQEVLRKVLDEKLGE